MDFLASSTGAVFEPEPRTHPEKEHIFRDLPILQLIPSCSPSSSHSTNTTMLSSPPPHLLRHGANQGYTTVPNQASLARCGERAGNQRPSLYSLSCPNCWSLIDWSSWDFPWAWLCCHPFYAICRTNRGSFINRVCRFRKVEKKIIIYSYSIFLLDLFTSLLSNPSLR